MELKTHKTISISSWIDFLNNHPNASVFHTPEMVELFDKVRNHEVRSCFVVENNKIKAMYLQYIHSNGLFPIKLLTTRSISWAGPLVEDNELALCKRVILESNTNGLVYSEIRNIGDNSWAKEALIEVGFKYEAHLDIWNDISDLEKLWNGFKSSRRNQIKRSEKRGLTTEVKLDLNPAEIKLCVYLLRKRYKELGHPLPNDDLFDKLHSSLVSSSRLASVMAYYEGELVGFLWGLLMKDKVFEWYTAFDTDHSDKFVNDRLAWEIMKWGNQNGYKIFDFGGAGKPNVPYGVRNFKLQFGGELYEFGRYLKIHRPLFMIFAQAIYYMAKRIKLMPK